MKTSKNKLKLNILILMLAVPAIICAQGSLIGKWKYEFPGGEMTMQINSNTLVIDGESYSYKAEKNNLQVYDGYSYTAYPYALNGNQLTLGFPDGTKIIFTRDSANSPAINNMPQSSLNSSLAKSPGSKSSSLSGKWLFQTPDQELVLEFLSGNQLIFNGETTQYQLLEGTIQAMGDYRWINYPYTLSQDKLLITFPDGTRVPFTRVSSGASNQTVTKKQSSGGGMVWQLQGSLCYWSGSSGSNSSYSRSERINFDGKGNFTYGKESSFSGNAGIAYSGNPNVEKGTYRVEEKFVFLQFQSGESYQVEIIMRQDNGRITELKYQGKLYATSLCD